MVLWMHSFKSNILLPLKGYKNKLTDNVYSITKRIKTESSDIFYQLQLLKYHLTTYQHNIWLDSSTNNVLLFQSSLPLHIKKAFYQE